MVNATPTLTALSGVTRGAFESYLVYCRVALWPLPLARLAWPRSKYKSHDNDAQRFAPPAPSPSLFAFLWATAVGLYLHRSSVAGVCECVSCVPCRPTAFTLQRSKRFAGARNTCKAPVIIAGLDGFWFTSL
eukprot:6079767-Prymnesium_polylepis.1